VTRAAAPAASQAAPAPAEQSYYQTYQSDYQSYGGVQYQQPQTQPQPQLQQAHFQPPPTAAAAPAVPQVSVYKPLPTISCRAKLRLLATQRQCGARQLQRPDAESGPGASEH
jgi:hypothetical protein